MRAGFSPHTDPHAWKFLRSQMGDDIFDSIVAARAAFLRIRMPPGTGLISS